MPAADGEHPRRAASRAGAGAAILLLLICLVSTDELRGGRREQALSPRAARLLLDPNTATRDELMLLPRIGPALSKRIVSYRESTMTTPAFSSADDLDRVRGIGPITVEKLRPHLCFGQQTSDIFARDP